MNNEQKRITDNLIRSYESLLSQETKARLNGNEKHLKACLDSQQRVLKKLNKLLSPGKTSAQQVPVKTEQSTTTVPCVRDRDKVVFPDGDEQQSGFAGAINRICGFAGPSALSSMIC